MHILVGPISVAVPFDVLNLAYIMRGPSAAYPIMALAASFFTMSATPS